MKSDSKIVHKLGLDLHGVIDAFPKIFASISTELYEEGWEIHIITGSMWKKTTEEKLKEYGITWTHHFSITDYLLEKGEKVRWQDPNSPWFDGEKWDRAKAGYCEKEKITVHIDDSKTYGKYFYNVPYFHINDTVVVDENVASTQYYHLRGNRKNYKGYFRSFCGHDLLGKKNSTKLWGLKTHMREHYCNACKIFLKLLSIK